MRTAGTCRFVYNRYIATNKERHKEGLKFQSGFDFSKYVNNELSKQVEYCWIKEVSSKAVKQAIMNGEKAFKKSERRSKVSKI